MGDDDKKSALQNSLSHIISCIPYKHLKAARIKLPKRDKKHAYDDSKPITKRRFVPEAF